MKSIINIYPEPGYKIECKNLRLTTGTVPVLRIGDLNVFASPEQLDEIMAVCDIWLTNNHVAEHIMPAPAEAATAVSEFDSRHPLDCNCAGCSSLLRLTAEPDDMPQIGEDGLYLLPDGKGSIFHDHHHHPCGWTLWLRGGAQTRHTTARLAWDYFKSLDAKVDADDLLGSMASSYEVVRAVGRE